MFIYIAYLVICTFSKENNHFSRENLPKNNIQDNIFDKSKNFYSNHRYSQVTLRKTTFNNEDCNNINDTYTNVDVKISECQSINKGISFVSNNQERNTVSISNSIFSFSSSLSERAMLVFQGTLLDIVNVTIKISSEGQFFSSPIFECSDLHSSSSPKIESLKFVDCILDSNISIFKLSNYPGITITDLLFEGQNVQCKSILESDSISTAQFNNCNFSNFNEKSTIFALNYIKGELHFTSCNFFNNKCSLFYLDETRTNLTTFDSCHFFDNNATNILSFIYLLGDMTKTIEHSIFTDCQFSNNFIYSSETDKNRYGTVIGLSTSLHFEGTNKFTNCHTISIDESDPLNKKNFGGALSILHVSDETYELANCSFDGCSATNMGGGFYSCALSNKTAVLQVTNCRFTNCLSHGNGGGFSCGTQIELKISSSHFKECTSPVGGGIFFNGTVEHATFSSTTFDKCEGKNGTAFHIRTSEFRLENIDIINHYSTSKVEDEYETTCIYLYTANEQMQITFSGVHFINNSGQSIEIRTPYTDQLETVNTFENCEFIGNNKFSTNYTLINCERVQASISVFNNCSFIENEGKCISSEMIYCESLMIISCSFNGNNGPKGVCLDVYLDKEDDKVFTLQSSIFQNNTAKSDGIVCIRNIEIDDDGDIIFKDNKITDASTSCSTMFVEMKQPKPISLSSFSFENCISSKIGSAIYICTSVSDEIFDISFTNFSFINNRNDENGGSILIETGITSKIELLDSYFKQNFAKNGGSIYIKEKSTESTCSVEISNCQFIDDEAEENGGSIFISAKNGTTIRSCNFTHSKAKINGGALSILHANNEIYELVNCSFDGCSATNMGGGFYSCALSDKTAALQLTNCNFASCISNVNGGGFSCGTQIELKISSSHFKECTSPVGGGIFFNGTVEHATFSSTTFDKCEGKNGTAFHIRTSEFRLENIDIINHYSTSKVEDEYETTCIYLYTANEQMQITFSGVHFINNSGQSIEIRTPYTDQLETVNTFENCEFIGNNEFSDSYTLINCERVQASITIFNNCSFIDNKGKCISSEMIYCESLMIISCSFNGNNGPKGVCLGIYLDKEDDKVFTLQSSIFQNNTAKSDGIVCIRNIEIDDDGDIIFKDNKITDASTSCSTMFVEMKQPKPISLSSFSFENCISSKIGSAIYICTSVSDEIFDISFTNFSFINNRNDENGGSILIETGITSKIELLDSYFKQNFAKNGGSIYIKEKSTESTCSIEISNCQFIDDEAEENGGSIFISAKNGATIRSCNFTHSKAKINGKSISIDLNSQVSLSKCTFYVESDSTGSSAIHVFSSLPQKQREFQGELHIQGGCFKCDKEGGKAEFLLYNVSQISSLKITKDSCFKLSKEESILVVGSSTTVEVDDSVFNCDNCDIIPVSETIPVSGSISPSQDDGGSGKKKLGVGAVIGIVLVVIATVCLAFVIVYVVKKRREINDDSLLRSVDSINQNYTV